MLVTTPDGTFWIPDLDPACIAYCLRLERRAQRIFCAGREHNCTVGPYPGRDVDEALMAEVLAMEDAD